MKLIKVHNNIREDPSGLRAVERLLAREDRGRADDRLGQQPRDRRPGAAEPERRVDDADAAHADGHELREGVRRRKRASE